MRLNPLWKIQRKRYFSQNAAETAPRFSAANGIFLKMRLKPLRKTVVRPQLHLSLFRVLCSPERPGKYREVSGNIGKFFRRSVDTACFSPIPFTLTAERKPGSVPRCTPLHNALTPPLNDDKILFRKGGRSAYMPAGKLSGTVGAFFRHYRDAEKRNMDESHL